jgi:adenylate cyclase
MPSPRRQIRESIGRGEFLFAYDQARAASASYPQDIEIGYLGALALARAGATVTAEQELNRLQLRPSRSRKVSPRLGEDLAALRARLAKDIALDATGRRRQQRAALAAARYEDVFKQFGRPYSCINAATMWWLAGSRARARELAQEALTLCRRARPRDAETRYWTRATEAEASLLLGRHREAATALDRARAAAPGMHGAWATTRRQFRLLGDAGCGAPGLADHLPVPSVVHFCGHMFDGAANGRDYASASLSARVREALQGIDAGVGFGSLACGADILVAEALLERGAELKVVLPCDLEDFRRVSVAPGGRAWERRFDACLVAASSILITTEGHLLGDDALFAHGARVAMGLTLVHARLLETEAIQVALWDGVPRAGAAGTSTDVRAWRATGRPGVVIPIASRSASTRRRAAAGGPGAAGGRSARSMLFGDVRGFGRLSDEHQRPFVKVVLTAVAEVLHRYQEPGSTLRSSGDGFFAVFRTAGTAARCAIELQERFAAIDLEGARLPGWLGLRIGGHAGPVMRLYDPLRKEYNHYGLQVTRAARIEPRTPVGEVYVTAPFAALLELEQNPDIECEYVGHMPTAKEHGVLPMYVLKRRG